MSINNLGPFEAEVWGTVSDWVMVIVTSGTLYFIIRNFRSQLKVQQLQQQYTLIENEKFRREIVPVFKLHISKTEFDKEAGQVIVALLLGVILTKNECNDLQIGLASIIYKPEILDIFPADSAHVPMGRHTILTIRCPAEKKVFDAYGLNLSIELKYRDVVGNGYLHNFMVNLTYTDQEIIANGPFRTLN